MGITCNDISTAADELGYAVDDNVSAEASRGENHGREGVVHDDGDAFLVPNSAELGYVSHGESRVRHALEIENLSLADLDGIPDHVEVVYVHERRGYVAGPGEEVGEEGVGTAVEGSRGDDVVAAADELQQNRRDGGHAAGGAVGGLGPLQRRHLPAEVQDGGVEVPAVDEKVPVGAELPGKHLAEGLRLHNGESGRGLDGHVHTAVLPKLMASTR